MLWTAPELLSADMQALPGNASGDIYAFGIILQEIICREGPFYINDDHPDVEGMCSHEITTKVHVKYKLETNYYNQ